MSTVDWPDHLSATVFTQNCPWNCFYCHNQALIPVRTPGAVAWGEVRDLLERRRGLLDCSLGYPAILKGLVRDFLKHSYSTTITAWLRFREVSPPAVGMVSRWEHKSVSSLVRLEYEIHIVCHCLKYPT